MRSYRAIAEYPITRATIDSAKEVIYTLDEADRIAYCNPAFYDFAKENGAANLTAEVVEGRKLTSILPSTLHDLFDCALAHVRGSRRCWSLEYDCSSPTLYRQFKLTFYPQPKGAAVIAVHSLRAQHPHSWQAVSFELKLYRNKNGLIIVCSNCRRTQLASLEAWDWVPEIVQTPRHDVSHGLCTICRDWLYGHLPTRNRG